MRFMKHILQIKGSLAVKSLRAPGIDHAEDDLFNMITFSSHLHS